MKQRNVSQPTCTWRFSVYEHSFTQSCRSLALRNLNTSKENKERERERERERGKRGGRDREICESAERDEWLVGGRESETAGGSHNLMERYRHKKSDGAGSTPGCKRVKGERYEKEKIRKTDNEILKHALCRVAHFSLNKSILEI